MCDLCLSFSDSGCGDDIVVPSPPDVPPMTFGPGTRRPVSRGASPNTPWEQFGNPDAGIPESRPLLL